MYTNVDVHVRLFPEEVILHIFKFLDGEHLLATERVCRRWASISNNPILWKRLCINRQRGAANLIGYKIAIGGETAEVQSKKRKASSLKSYPLKEWKAFFFHYHKNNLFSGHSTIEESTLFAELQSATEQMSVLIRNNMAAPDSELIWLYSMVFCCQSEDAIQHIHDIYQNAVKDQCQSSWKKLSSVEGIQYLTEFVNAWKNYLKYVDTLYAFFRCLEKKITNTNLKSDARATFLDEVFHPGCEKAKTFAMDLLSTKDAKVVGTLTLLKDMFTSFGATFIEFNPSAQNAESSQCSAVTKPIRFIASDGTQLSDGEYLVEASPVLRDILKLSGRVKW